EADLCRFVGLQQAGKERVGARWGVEADKTLNAHCPHNGEYPDRSHPIGQSGERRVRRQAHHHRRPLEVLGPRCVSPRPRQSMMSGEVEADEVSLLTLTELEQDALAELANIGVSRAASSLRKMVGQQVLLSVPSVEVVNQRTAAALVSEREGSDLV